MSVKLHQNWNEAHRQVGRLIEHLEQVEAEVERLREREAALAAALKKHTRHCADCPAHPWMWETSPGPCNCGLAQAFADPAPILAAVRRAAQREALREWRARFGYHAPGENTILDEINAAIAALDAEEK